MIRWLTKRLGGRRKLSSCINCGCDWFDYPQAVTPEWLEEHRCSSGRGHFFTDDPVVARLVREDAKRG